MAENQEPHAEVDSSLQEETAQPQHQEHTQEPTETTSAAEQSQHHEEHTDAIQQPPAAAEVAQHHEEHTEVVQHPPAVVQHPPAVVQQAPEVVQHHPETDNTSQNSEQTVQIQKKEDTDQSNTLPTTHSEKLDATEKEQEGVDHFNQEKQPSARRSTEDFANAQTSASSVSSSSTAQQPLTPLERRQRCLEAVKQWDIHSTSILNLHAKVMHNLTRYVEDFQKASHYFISRYLDFLNHRVHQSRLFQQMGLSPLVDIRTYHAEVGAQYGQFNDALVVLQKGCDDKVAKQKTFSEIVEGTLLRALLYPHVQEYQTAADLARRDVDHLKRQLQELTNRCAIKSNRFMRIYQAQISNKSAAQLFLDGNQHKKCLFKALNSFLRLRFQIADTQRQLGRRLAEFWSTAKAHENARHAILKDTIQRFRDAWQTCHGEIQQHDQYLEALEGYTKTSSEFAFGLKFIDPETGNQLDDYMQGAGLGMVNELSVLKFLSELKLQEFDRYSHLSLIHLEAGRELLPNSAAGRPTRKVQPTIVVVSLDNYIYCFDHTDEHENEEAAKEKPSGSKFAHYNNPYARQNVKLEIEGCFATAISHTELSIGPQGNAFVKLFTGQITKENLVLTFKTALDQQKLQGTLIAILQSLAIKK